MEPHSRPASFKGEAENHLGVIVIDPDWHRFVPRVTMIALRAVAIAGVQARIILASDRLTRDLNARHRGKNKPTNVLTYESPAQEIILSLGVIRREAAAAGKSVAHHLAHLIVHGALHLLGFDHDHPGDARRMEMEESRLLHRIGVPNPWRRA